MCIKISYPKNFPSWDEIIFGIKFGHYLPFIFIDEKIKEKVLCSGTKGSLKLRKRSSVQAQKVRYETPPSLGNMDVLNPPFYSKWSINFGIAKYVLVGVTSIEYFPESTNFLRNGRTSKGSQALWRLKIDCLVSFEALQSNMHNLCIFPYGRNIL